MSGDEEKVRMYILGELSKTPNVTYIETDDYGNLHATMVSGDGSGATIHLNSHMDTVRNCQADKRIVVNDGVYQAVLPDGSAGVLGADDRAGIATILTIINYMPKFDGVVKVSFYREEEIGCVGSSKSDLDFLNDVDLSVTFDRKGSSDIVVGTWGQAFACNEVGFWLEDVASNYGFDFSCVEGGISDAMTISENHINAINLSVGYYNEHTANEFLIFKELYTSMEFAKSFISEINNVYQTFTEVPSTNHWIQNYSKSSSYHSYNDPNYEYGFGNDYGQTLESPFAYLNGSETMTVVSDGNYEMLMTPSEVDDLIKQLQICKEIMESNTAFSEVIEGSAHHEA